MNKRTEAERLADRLETDHRLDSPNEEAAAELRRLQAEVDRLNKAPDYAWSTIAKTTGETK